MAGPSNPNVSTLRDESKSSKHKMEVIRNVLNMPDIMAWADLTVSAGGSTCWELAFMGLPAVVIVTAENQKGIASGSNEYGSTINLGWYSDLGFAKISFVLEHVIKSFEKRESMTLKGKELVDGFGREKVNKKMKVTN